jgi:hypothetical protein
MPLYKDTRHIALNLPRTEVGDRLQAAILMEHDENERSLSKVIIRIVSLYVASQDRDYHDRVDAVQEEIEAQRLRAEAGDASIFSDKPDVFGPPELRMNDDDDDRWGDGTPG